MSKTTLFLVLIIISLSSFSQSPTLPEVYWKDQEIFGVNKLPPHATLFPFESKEKALLADKTKSEWFQSLDGQWHFHWAKKPADRPAFFFQPDYDVSQWDKLPVPANWEVHGYGYPIYLDEKYPFETEWPDISDEYNPVGSYKRTFEAPASWADADLLAEDGANTKTNMK